MRTLITSLLFVLLLSPTISFSQVQIESKTKTITIDLDISLDSINVPVSKGEYELLTKLKTKSIEYFFVDKKLIEYPPLTDSLEVSNPKSNISGVTNSRIILRFYDNTKYVVTVKLKDEEKFRKYILQSKSDWTWKTSFGANAVVLINTSKFVNVNGVVSDNTDRKRIDLMPSLMFTFMNFQQNFAFGFTAGLGTDFNKISIFTGASVGIGQNIIITAGTALHEQTRPDSDFNVGQKVDPSLANDKLNKEYYRVNPFIGITFNLNNNPFKK